MALETSRKCRRLIGPEGPAAATVSAARMERRLLAPSSVLKEDTKSSSSKPRHLVDQASPLTEASQWSQQMFPCLGDQSKVHFKRAVVTSSTGVRTSRRLKAASSQTSDLGMARTTPFLAPSKRRMAPALHIVANKSHRASKKLGTATVRERRLKLKPEGTPLQQLLQMHI